MNRIFNPDGRFFSILNRMADLMWLNILYIICCIPVFTIGPATTALFYVTMKMVKDEESYITRSYFKSFKENFKQGVMLWLIVLAAGIVIIVDLGVLTGSVSSQDLPVSDIVAKIITTIMMIIGILYLFTVTYIFPLLAKFDNTVKNTIKNAFLMSIINFPSTVVLLLIPVLAVVLMYFINQLITLILILTLSLIAYIGSHTYVKVFEKYIPSDEVSSEECK